MKDIPDLPRNTNFIKVELLHNHKWSKSPRKYSMLDCVCIEQPILKILFLLRLCISLDGVDYQGLSRLPCLTKPLLGTSPAHGDLEANLFLCLLLQVESLLCCWHWQCSVFYYTLSRIEQTGVCLLVPKFSCTLESSGKFLNYRYLGPTSDVLSQYLLEFTVEI